MTRKHKKLFILLISLVLIMTMSVTSLAQSVGFTHSSEPLHYMGALPDMNNNAEIYSFNEDVTTYTVLPSSVDNSYLYPTPGEQFQNDCVAWAIGYAQMANMQALNRGWTVDASAHKFSPSFLYNMSGGGQDGLVLGTAMNRAIRYGVCPVTYYPIDNPYTASVHNLAVEAAALYKPTSYYVTSSLTEMKQAIAAGKGISMGVHVYSEMYYNMSETNYIYDDVSGSYVGAHAICLVGYDDSLQAFKFINSWGDDWCLDGFGWIAYDLVASDEYNLYGACHGYVMRFAETDDYVMGDVNSDNAVTSADSRLVRKYIQGTSTLTDRQYVLADVDGNGIVDSDDALNIMNYASMNLNKFPLYE